MVSVCQYKTFFKTRRWEGAWYLCVPIQDIFIDMERGRAMVIPVPIHKISIDTINSACANT